MKRLTSRWRAAGMGAAALAAAGGAVFPGAWAQAQGGDLTAMLEPIRKQHDLPALAAAVIVDGKTAGTAAVGVRKYGSDVPVTTDDRFHIGSCTKSMTATLIGMLVEQGKLRWDSTPAQVFPALAAGMHADYRSVTLEHFLAHRSGLPNRSTPLGKSLLDLHRLPGSPMEQRLAYIRMMLAETPDYPAGSKMVYSNAGFAVAAAMAERVTGTPWEQLITRMLFQPLGMTSAGFGAMGTPGKVDQPWQHVLRDGRVQPIPPGPRSDNPDAIGPGGKVHCSMADWAKYAVLHLQGEQGKDGLLKAATIKKLHTPEFGGEYAGGWFQTERSWGRGRVLMHNGSNTQNFAVIWLAPLRNFAVMTATNQGGDTADKACDEAAAGIIRRFLSRG